MQIFKTALVVMTGLGAAWTADQVTTRLAGGDAPRAAGPAPIVLAQSGQPAAPPAAAATAPESAQEALSEAEIDAELERIEKAAAGATDELEEFVPTKPLAADIPLAWPSDI